MTGTRETPVAEAANRDKKQSFTALTVCSLSNTRLCVYDHIREHPILELLNTGLYVTVNSDHSAYFGGYLCQNFIALATVLDMIEQQAKQLACNSFEVSFLPIKQK